VAFCHGRRPRSLENPWALEGLAPWDRLKAAGVPFQAAGENLAMGHATAQMVHEAWRASPGHHQNMLTPYWTRVGIGRVRCNGATPYWAEDFLY